MALEKETTLALFKRVYNNKMITDAEVPAQSDEVKLKGLCARVFQEGIENFDPSLIHQFNNLVVSMANEVANRDITDIVRMLADYSQEAGGNIKEIKIPQKAKLKFLLSANNSGVELLNVFKKKSIMAVPETYKMGISYNPNDFNDDAVRAFNELVGRIAETKLSKYLKIIYALVTASATSGVIPSSNVIEGSGLTIVQFNKLVSTITRVGKGRPIFLADPLLVDNFVAKQIADEGISKTFSDDTKDMLYRELNYTKIGRADAFNIINPFEDDTNTSVELPVDKGFMLSSAISAKPINIVEYGAMTQKTRQEFETDEIQFIVSFKASVKLIHGDAIGYIADDAVVL